MCNSTGSSKRFMMVVTLACSLCWLSESRLALGGETKGNKEPGVAARVGDQVVTVDDVEKAIAIQLARLQEQRYQLIELKLEELIGTRLLDQEAKRRGVTVEELVKKEALAKAPAVADAEVSAFIAQNKARLPQDTPELRRQVRDHLVEQRAEEARRAYVAGLEKAVKVERLLEEPEPIRLSVTSQGAFSQGIDDAPVTIVEFSDFQCPFCRNVVGTLKEVMRQYPGRVKWAFRDFPIASLHPKAHKAAEAARCAGEQGRFWDYHDFLFEHQAQANTEDFKRFADQLKLDGKRFALCLESGRTQAAVDSDMQEGARLGISGTPTLFINGRLMVGAQPLETFRRIIERELRHSSK